MGSVTPHFSIIHLHQAAASEHTLRLTRNAQRDALNLGYTLEEVQAVLLSLTPQHFCKAHDYMADVYQCRWEKDGFTDELYVKVTLQQDGQWVVTVLSFHRSR